MKNNLSIYMLYFFCITLVFSCKENDSKAKLVRISGGRLGGVEEYVVTRNGKMLFSFEFNKQDSCIASILLFNDSINQYFDFYDNGLLRFKTLLSKADGSSNGPGYFFYRNSNYLWTSFTFRNDLKVGSGLEYHDSTDLIKSIFEYNDNGELYFKKSFDRYGKFIKQEGSRF